MLFDLRLKFKQLRGKFDNPLLIKGVDEVQIYSTLN